MGVPKSKRGHKRSTPSDAHGAHPVTPIDEAKIAAPEAGFDIASDTIKLLETNGEEPSSNPPMAIRTRANDHDELSPVRLKDASYYPPFRSRRVRVSNMGRYFTLPVCRKFFSQFGDVVNLRAVKVSPKTPHINFLVEFKSVEIAKIVIDAVHGTHVFGRVMKLYFARECRFD